ncbi:MAG TPA: acetate/propionate family kinase [Feifaniaceae bacterium]|nr:acetate/propionate family kinase [Feifaniaceae bacterium]
MKILVCNVGSTSLKYRLFDFSAGETVLAEGKMERVGAELGDWTHRDADGEAVTRPLPIPDYASGIRLMLEALQKQAIRSLDEIGCVAFKVVHAKGVTGVQRLNEDVLSAMAAFNTVAPSHNPPYIAAIRQFQMALPNTPLIGSFETGFHATMPPEAYLYSIPLEVSRKFAIRRYGFHGASHEYVTGRVTERMGSREFRLISCHLGGSGSLSAVVNGRSVDTNLGLSLQCGVMHNNRCGDIDPYILVYLMEDCGYTLEQVKTMLNKQSGMLGMSGVSNDLRDVERAAENGNADAALAIESYCYHIKKQIGAYAAAMGGVDAIAFTGGIGENSALVRKKSLSGLEYMGVMLDEAKNDSCRCDCELTAFGGRVRLFAVAANEELVVARKAKAFLEESNPV